MNNTVLAGNYIADTDHSSVQFRIRHLGLAWYVVRFTRFSARLAFDPEAPEAMRVEAAVEVASLDTAYTGPHGNWNARLALDGEWLDGARHPSATFASDGVERTGPSSARVSGDLTLRGVTRRLKLDARYCGGVHSDQFGRMLVGFSARGRLLRSEFGLTNLLGPIPDEVELIIEGEFART